MRCPKPIIFKPSMSTSSMAASIEMLLEQDEISTHSYHRALTVAAARLRKLEDLLNGKYVEESTNDANTTEVRYIPEDREFNDTETRTHRRVIDGYSEMLVAIDKAGGAIEYFTWKKLQHMSAAHLIESLTPNMQITFTPNPKR